MHKKDQGKLGEALVISQALDNGCAAFPEFGDNSKIDLIIETTDGKLVRVQVKCVGRETKTPDVSKLYLYKSGPNYNFQYEEGMVDWFAVVDMITKKIAWINATSIHEEFSKGKYHQVTLRHSPTKSGQKIDVRFFDDYTKFPF